MNVIISGSSGSMGKVLTKVMSAEGDMHIIAGFDSHIGDDPVPFKQYISPKDSTTGADVVIDFSHFSAIPDLVDFCVRTETPAVIATTALGKDERKLLHDASKHIPIFNSANMSLGINILSKMSKLAMPALEEDFNVEIIEKHHDKKKDSPSGTALLLAESINEACETKKDFVYGRHGKDDDCKLTDLGIHAVRGGTIPGQHTIMFAGPDEVIEITHTVYSKVVFAQGAIKAARFLVKQDPGFYTMEDLLES